MKIIIEPKMNLYEMDELLDVQVGGKFVKDMIVTGTPNILTVDVVRAIANAVIKKVRLEVSPAGQ